MAEATAINAKTGAPRKRAPFVRTERPVFAVISYTDEDGNPVKLSKARLSIKVEKDMEKLVSLLEDTDGYSVVAKLDMPKASVRAPNQVAE